MAGKRVIKTETERKILEEYARRDLGGGNCLRTS